MASEGSDSYEKTSVIRGHHIYKSVWIPFIGEELVVEAEDSNEHDEHRCHCDEGQLCCQARPSLYLLSLLVLLQTW